MSSAWSLLRSECSFLFEGYLQLSALSFRFSVFTFCFSLQFFLLFYLSIPLLPHHVSLHSVFQARSWQWLRQVCKYRVLKVDAHIVLYEELDVIPKAVGLTTICSASMTIPDGFQRRLYCVHQNCKSVSDLILIIAVVINMDSFPVQCPYEFRCTLMDEVPATLGNVSEYGFYLWKSQAMKVIGTKSNESPSKKEFDQDISKEEN